MKQPSRTSRFLSAAQGVLDAVEAAKSETQEILDKIEELNNALDGTFQGIEDRLQELRDVREEYQEWKDNVPDSLQSSPMMEKLEAICDIDLEPQMPEKIEVEEPDWSSIEDAAQECLDADLPRGFGRD